MRRRENRLLRMNTLPNEHDAKMTVLLVQRVYTCRRPSVPSLRSVAQQEHPMDRCILQSALMGLMSRDLVDCHLFVQKESNSFAAIITMSCVIRVHKYRRSQINQNHSVLDDSHYSTAMSHLCHISSQCGDPDQVAITIHHTQRSRPPFLRIQSHCGNYDTDAPSCVTEASLRTVTAQQGKKRSHGITH